MRFPSYVMLFAALVLCNPARSSAQTFADVPTDYWAYGFIETLAETGVTTGCGGGDYCPEEPVSRAQMAVFLERGMRGSSYNPPAATGTIFNDIAANDFAAAYIEQFFADGITSGCGGGNYCPNDRVTRAQMAVFLLRAKHGADYSPPASSGVFADVPVGNFADRWIEQLVAEGITGGCGNGNYCPDAPVTRAQMAVFLVKAFGLQQLFDHTPLVLVDPDNYYSALACLDPNQPNIQFVIPVAINGDTHDDFIVHYWCDLPFEEWGSDVLSPTPDMLVAFLSDGKGGYSAANELVFGESFPSLGGASRKYASGDMNGDGRPDFAFALNWEDGRSDVSIYANPAVLLSNDSGGYSVQKLGNPTWGHAVDMVDNAVGTQDALFAGFMVGEEDLFQAFRFNGNGFTDVTEEYPGRSQGWASGFRFFSGDSGPANLAVGTNTITGVSIGFNLYSKSSGGWQQSGNFSLDVVRQENCTLWNGVQSLTDVFAYQGAEYYFALFDEFVVSDVSLVGSVGALVIAKLAAATPEGGIVDPSVGCDQNSMINVNQFVFLEIVDGELRLIEEPVILDSNVEINANFYDFEDINNDSLPDLVVQAFSADYLGRELAGVPDVYINRGGVLSRLDTKNFPGLSNRFVPSQGYLHDVNQDGLPDLVVFGLTAGQFGDIEIYLSNRNID